MAAIGKMKHWKLSRIEELFKRAEVDEELAVKCV